MLSIPVGAGPESLGLNAGLSATKGPRKPTANELDKKSRISQWTFLDKIRPKELLFLSWDIMVLFRKARNTVSLFQLLRSEPFEPAAAVYREKR